MKSQVEEQTPCIFISYSHKDRAWQERIITHLKALENTRQCRLWDDTRIQPGDEWNPEIQRALEGAHIIILLLSPHFLASRFIMENEVPIAFQRRQKGGVVLLPVLLRQCAWKNIERIASLQVWPGGGSPLSNCSETEVDNKLVELMDHIKNHCLNRAPHRLKAQKPFVPLLPSQITTSRLPVSSEFLFGREAQLEQLNLAWQEPVPHIVILTAWGGVGKTALVNRWLDRMEADHYRGAEKVYAWSFYSQGTEEGKQASADLFIRETLDWFGDPAPDDGSAVEKGRRLARLVSGQKTLLILDGIEPLQFPPGSGDEMAGKFKDPGMRVFLRELASAGDFGGLCVVTSRLGLTDLDDKKGEGQVLEVPLSSLSQEAGLELLKKRGVVGGEGQLREAVSEYEGHALALDLLGRFVKKAYKGDIRRRDTIPLLTKTRGKENHAWRVMAAYEAWLGDSVERDILYLLGLFDRPVSMGVLDFLGGGEAIPGVTENVKQLGEADWGISVSNLAEAGLVADVEPGQPEILDCHPLVREYFGERLQDQNPEGWQEAHRRLFNYYEDLPEKLFPDTLEEMEPLFAAVAHGCRAGLYQEALDDVLWKRLRRGEKGYIFNQLGAFGSYISVLANFFESPWSQLASVFSEEDQAIILSWSAFGLRAVGRLREAIQPMKVGMKMSEKQKDCEGTMADASNLSGLLLTLGEVSSAVTVARQTVTLADGSGDWAQKVTGYTTLADALLQSGHMEEAERWFCEAETLQKKGQPEYPYLYSSRGYKYCDLLLAGGTVRMIQQVKERAEKGLEIVNQLDLSLLCIALDHLTLGRAWMASAAPGDNSHFLRALAFLDTAVEKLQESGNQDELPLGLIYRAHCYRLMCRFESAAADLAEAHEIAQLGDMKLFLVDYHLESARLNLAQTNREEAVKHRDIASALIEQTGYNRRLKELNLDLPD